MVKKLPQLLVFFTASLAYAYFLLTDRELLSMIRDVQLSSVFAVVGISAIPLMINGLILKVLIRPFGVHLFMKEAFAISSLTALGNYAIMRVGTVGKALYLKKRYDFRYLSFITVMTAAYLLDFLLASIVGVVSVITIGRDTNLFLSAAFYGFTLSALIISGFMLLPLKTPVKSGKVWNKIKHVLEGWNLIRKNRYLLLMLGFLLLTNYLLASLQLFFCYRAFSIDIGFVPVLFMIAISTFPAAMKITPANLGVYEGLIAISSEVLGLGAGEGLLAAGLLRIISTATIILSAGIFGTGLNFKRSDVEG